MTDLEQLRYPIGRFERLKAPLDRAGARGTYRDNCAAAGDNGGVDPRPQRGAARTPYRPGGWTVRQVVHHVPESHMNAYVRMKLGADRRLAGDQDLRGTVVGAAAGVQEMSDR